MPAYLTPGVYVEHVDRPARPISAIRTDIAAFVGLAERGPLHRATRIRAWEEFRATFGGLVTTGYLGYAVKAFFENGGRLCHVVRVAAPEATATSVGVSAPTESELTSIAGLVPGAGAVLVQDWSETRTVAGVDAATRLVTWTAALPATFVPTQVAYAGGGGFGSRSDPSARQPHDGSGLVLESVDGLVPGAAVEITQPRRQRNLVSTVVAGARHVRWVLPVAPALDPARSFHVTSGAARAGLDVRDGRWRPALSVEAATPGTWGDRLAVVVTRSRPAATDAVAVTLDDEHRLTVGRTDGFEPYTLVRLQQATTAGLATTHRYVTAVDPLRRVLTFDRPFQPDGPRPVSLESVELSISIYLDDDLVTVVGGLGVHPEHSFAVGGRVAAEELAHVSVSWIRPTDLGDPDAAAAMLPATRGRARLWGGTDGLAALEISDLTGDPASTELTGLRVLEPVDEVAVVAMPDAHIRPIPPPEHAPLPPPPVDECFPEPAAPATAQPVPAPIELPPRFDAAAVVAAFQRLVGHCETLRDRVAILDPPDGLDVGEITEWRANFDTRYAALYYPWVRVPDPRSPALAEARLVPPSGHVAGVIARADLADGPHRAPANLGLRWIHDVETPVDAAAQSGLNPRGINAIRPLPGRGIRIYGARTVSSDPAWRFLPVRRLVAMIEEAVEEAIPWAVFEPNDASLRNAIRTAIGSFLRTLWRSGALVGARPNDAYFVKCDQDNNPPEIVDAGRLVADVGIAPTRPAEFVVFRIGRTENELEIVG